jgi:hypothetical protein
MMKLVSGGMTWVGVGSLPEELPATIEEVLELLYGEGTVLLVRPPEGWSPEWVHDEHRVMQ